MEKVTLKHIRSMVAHGIAADMGSIDAKDRPEYTRVEKIYYSAGVYGINGAVLIDRETGDLYAIIGRSSLLFSYC